MDRRALLLILLFAAAAIYFGYFLPKKTGVQIGDAAPNFSIQDRDGQTRSLQDYRGETVLLNFWATWCPPCVWEMPSLERLHKTLGADGFRVLAVSLDEQGWPPVDQFLERVSISFPILLDAQGEVANIYGTFQLPETYLIGPDGIVLKKYIGPREWDDAVIVSEIRNFLTGGEES